MEITSQDFKKYVDKVLELYCNTPGTVGRVRREDRRLAGNLYRRGISLCIIEQSMILAAARRYARAPDASPLSPIRSLHYFVPVIEEISTNPPSADYFKYLKMKLAKIRMVSNKAVLESQYLKPP